MYSPVSSISTVPWMLWILQKWRASCRGSTCSHTLTMTISSPYFSARLRTSSSSGASAWQGPHQLAKKFRMYFFPRYSSDVRGRPVTMSGRLKAGSGLPIRGCRQSLGSSAGCALQPILEHADRAGARVRDVHGARLLVDRQVAGRLADRHARPLPAACAVDHAHPPGAAVGRVDAVPPAPEAHAHRSALDGQRVHDLLPVQVHDRHGAHERVRDVGPAARRVHRDLARRVVELDLADRLVRLPVDDRHGGVAEVDAVDAVPHRVRPQAPRRHLRRHRRDDLEPVGVDDAHRAVRRVADVHPAALRIESGAGRVVLDGDLLD